jgi:hypothetical protein
LCAVYYVITGEKMDILQEILEAGMDMPFEESFQPGYILSGSGFDWFYSDSKKTMVRIARGSECIVFEKDPSNSTKFIVQVGNDLLSISEDELIEIGWN